MSLTKYGIILILLIFVLPLEVKAQIEYPKTLKKKTVNNYHGIDVIDEFQWLEKLGTSQVNDWVKEQNRLSTKYLKKIVGPLRVESDMNKYMYSDFEEFDEKKNDQVLKSKYRYRIMYPGKDSPPAIYFKKGTRSSYERLISGSLISKKDYIDLNYYKPSRGDNFLAYQYSRNGSDWREIKIVGIKRRKFFKETLKYTKGSGIHWMGQGFFYKKYPYDSITGKSVFPRIMYHKLDTGQSEDELVYKAENEAIFLNLFGSSDEELYILKKENFKNKKFSYYYLSDDKQSLKFKPLLLDIKYDLFIIKHKDGMIYAQTIFNNKKQLISFPVNEPKKWKIVSPKFSNAVLTDYEFLEDKIFFSYHTQKNGLIAAVDHEGKLINKLVMPDGLSIRNLNFAKEYNKLFFTMQSYTIPPVICKFDIDKFDYAITGKTSVNFDYKNYRFIQEEFVSKDGTKVPIFIVFKDSLSNKGDTPFLIKTYGGYGNVALPSFDPGIIYFLEKGGAFAYINVRGGGLLGQKWREGGKRLNKVNSINDFIGGAKFLIEKGYTKPKKIAITGSSHGGLITAASLIQRPELFGAAVVDVGALDMLRFEKFTVGATSTNLNEFGTVKDELDFKNLYSYSPYHNIKNGTNYPSILIVTGSNDDRVPPLHSFKFTARLQSNSSQKNPIILWTQEKAGHFGADKIFDRLKEKSFIYGFLFHEVNK